MAGRFQVEAIFRAIDRFTAPVARMERRATRFMRSLKGGMDRLGSAVSGAVAGLRTVGTYAGIAGAAIGAAGYQVVKAGGDFEAGMAAVGAVMLKSTSQIKALEDKALDLGRTTKFTATEVSQGMELMARAGFKEADILGGIEGVLSAAAAAGMDLAETTDHVSNVLKGMGLEASQATRVADVLALAASRTNSTIGSLGESMRNVSSTARTLNIPLEQVVAAVASLQDVGLDASVAGSAMNTMLTKLAKPTADIEAKMKKWGITWKDAKGNMLPLNQVLANMAKAAEQSGGNLEQVGFFADLVGLRGQKAAQNLKDLFTSGKYGELAKELENAQGAAKKMADLRMDNLWGDLTLLKSAVEGVFVSLYKTSGGPLRDIVKGWIDWVGANKELIQLKVDEFVKKITPLIEGFTTEFKDTVKETAGAFSELFAAGKDKATEQSMGNIGRDLGRIAAMIAVVSAAVAVLGTAIGFTFGWLFRLIKQGIDSIAKLVGRLIFAFTDTWNNIGAILSNSKTTFFEKAKDIGKAIFKGIVQALSALVFGEELKQTAKDIADVIRKHLKLKVEPPAPPPPAGGPRRPSQVNPPPAVVTPASYRVPVLEAVGRGLGRGAVAEYPRPRPQLPEARGYRVERSETSHSETSTAVLTIRDETGRAKLSRQSGSRKGPAKIQLEPSGAFI